MSVVREFHRAVGGLAPDVPPLRVNPDDVRLRLRLIREEYEEVRDQLTRLAKLGDKATPDETFECFRWLLKELADLRYVVEGTAVTFGLPFDEAYAEVHRSNMSKLGPDGRPLLRADGKVLKGPGYRPPSMEHLVPNITNQEAEDA